MTTNTKNQFLRYSYIILLLPLILFICVSCLTIPENYQGKGYVFFKVEIIDETASDLAVFDNFIIKIVPKSNETVSAEFGVKSGYHFSANFPPGYYSDYTGYYSKKNYPFNFVDTPMLVKPDTITIFPFKFKMRISMKGVDERIFWYKLEPVLYTEKELDQLVERFSKNKNFQTWDAVLVGDQILVDNIKSYMEEKDK